METHTLLAELNQSDLAQFITQLGLIDTEQAREFPAEVLRELISTSGLDIPPKLLQQWTELVTYRHQLQTETRLTPVERQRREHDQAVLTLIRQREAEEKRAQQRFHELLPYLKRLEGQDLVLPRHQLRNRWGTQFTYGFIRPFIIRREASTGAASALTYRVRWLA